MKVYLYTWAGRHLTEGLLKGEDGIICERDTIVLLSSTNNNRYILLPDGKVKALLYHFENDKEKFSEIKQK